MFDLTFQLSFHKLENKKERKYRTRDLYAQNHLGTTRCTHYSLLEETME